MIKKIIMTTCCLFILASCVPYPSCNPEKGSCIILSESETIHIPFILPITSQSQILVQEQQLAISTAFEEVFGKDQIFSLDYYDNLNSEQKNNALIYSIIEDPTNPIIFYNIYPTENPEIDENQLIPFPGATIPNHQQLLIQAMDYLSQINIQSSLMFTSYTDFNLIKQTSFCANTPHTCFIYNEINTNAELINLVTSTDILIFATNFEEFSLWVSDFPQINNKKIVFLDTEFQTPTPLTINNIQPFWLTPLHSENETNSAQNATLQTNKNWDYYLSELTMQFCLQAFSEIKENINTTNHGFKIIYQEEIYNSILSTSPIPQVSFNLYQFDGTQFIMKNLN